MPTKENEGGRGSSLVKSQNGCIFGKLSHFGDPIEPDLVYIRNKEKYMKKR